MIVLAVLAAFAAVLANPLQEKAPSPSPKECPVGGTDFDVLQNATALCGRSAGTSHSGADCETNFKVSNTSCHTPSPRPPLNPKTPLAEGLTLKFLHTLFNLKGRNPSYTRPFPASRVPAPPNSPTPASHVTDQTPTTSEASSSVYEYRSPTVSESIAASENFHQATALRHTVNSTTDSTPPLRAASTVAIPFKFEDPEVLKQTIQIAAQHPSVVRVVAVGFSEDTLGPAHTAVAQLSNQIQVQIDVIAQRRFGNCRGGKGDAMLTAFDSFLSDPSAERLHFYDADIRTFESSWITKAETALDKGWDVARHYFDRASTDAQITWHITKDGFALLWPSSLLPDIQQPLGGELALTRRAAERLFNSPAVRSQSDWGIDTAMTVVMAAERLSVSEVYVPSGKLHGLYGSLADLRTMATECLEALRRLRAIPVPSANKSLHHVETPGDPPLSVSTKVAFDLESTLPLLVEGWTDEERALASSLPDALSQSFHLMSHSGGMPVWNFMRDSNWRVFLSYLLTKNHYEHSNAAWRSLFFRGWVARTIRHTTSNALRGYGPAMASLQETVEAFRKKEEEE